MKRTFSVFCAAALASTVAWATSAPIFTGQLANGLTVIVKPDRRAPTAVHMLLVRVGSMDEVDGTSGVAHVLEHMMFKGSDTLKAGEFSRRVTALGGRENAFTGRDMTGYFQQIPSERLSDVMALEADRFAHNRWPDEEFKKEIEVVKEERRLRTEDNPHSRLYEQLNAISFIASPYRRPVVGWMSDLDAMTPDDARAFYRRWYTPQNAALVVAGDVEPEAVMALAQRTYGAIETRAVPTRKPQTEPPQAGPRRLDFKAPADQAYLTLAFKTEADEIRALAKVVENGHLLLWTRWDNPEDRPLMEQRERLVARQLGPGLVTDPAGLDVDALIGAPAVLVFERGGAETRRMGGLIAGIRDSMHEETGKMVYDLWFAPRAFRLGLVETYEIFMDLSVPDIVKKKLERENIIKDVRMKRYAEKPSERKRRKNKVMAFTAMLRRRYAE
mgnify:CR=1 FL=1